MTLTNFKPKLSKMAIFSEGIVALEKRKSLEQNISKDNFLDYLIEELSIVKKKIDKLQARPSCPAWSIINNRMLHKRLPEDLQRELENFFAASMIKYGNSFEGGHRQFWRAQMYGALGFHQAGGGGWDFKMPNRNAVAVSKVFCDDMVAAVNSGKASLIPKEDLDRFGLSYKDVKKFVKEKRGEIKKDPRFKKSHAIREKLLKKIDQMSEQLVDLRDSNKQKPKKTQEDEKRASKKDPNSLINILKAHIPVNINFDIKTLLTIAITLTVMITLIAVITVIVNINSNNTENTAAATSEEGIAAAQQGDGTNIQNIYSSPPPEDEKNVLIADSTCDLSFGFDPQNSSSKKRYSFATINAVGSLPWSCTASQMDTNLLWTGDTYADENVPKHILPGGSESIEFLLPYEYREWPEILSFSTNLTCTLIGSKNTRIENFTCTCRYGAWGDNEDIYEYRREQPWRDDSHGCWKLQ